MGPEIAAGVGALGSLASGGAAVAGAAKGGDSAIIKPGDVQGAQYQLPTQPIGQISIPVNPQFAAAFGGPSQAPVAGPPAPPPQRDSLLDLARQQAAPLLQAPSFPSEAVPAQKGKDLPSALAAPATKGAAPGAAPQPSSGFLGLDGNTWSGISTATGILASLMKSGPATQPLTPGIQGPPGIQQQVLGSGLGGSTAGLGRLSNFAIHSPLLGRGASQADLLSSLSQ